jgi:hypothetical protein
MVLKHSGVNRTEASVSMVMIPTRGHGTVDNQRSADLLLDDLPSNERKDTKERRLIIGSNTSWFNED